MWIFSDFFPQNKTFEDGISGFIKHQSTFFNMSLHSTYQITNLLIKKKINTLIISENNHQLQQQVNETLNSDRSVVLWQQWVHRYAIYHLCSVLCVCVFTNLKMGLCVFSAICLRTEFSLHLLLLTLASLAHGPHIPVLYHLSVKTRP